MGGRVAASDEAWEKTIGLADMNGTVARVSFEPASGDFDASTAVAIRTGAANVNCLPTATALRQWAAAVLDGADAMEGSA
jgi:hypothetical protein